MSDITLTAIDAAPATSALQGPLTNALVHNPFAFEEVAEAPATGALQGPSTNALVHNPFAFDA